MINPLIYDIAHLLAGGMVLVSFMLLYISLIGAMFAPWGVAQAGAGLAAYAIGVAAYLVKLAIGGFLLAMFETAIAKMRVFRVPDFLGAALMLALLAALLMFMTRSL